jgi:esterase/lipase superfamily enzyme
LAWYIDNGKVTVYCPDAIDLESFYNKSIHPARQNADAQRVRKCDRSRMPDPWKYNHMSIIIGTGEWDVTRYESYRLSEVLNSKGIRHWLDDGKWRGHDWNYWQDMLPYYLSIVV